MFGSEEQPVSGPSRYTVRLVSGQMRQKSHQQSVQEALDESSSRDRSLVSATTTNASGSWVTGVYWDTRPER